VRNRVAVGASLGLVVVMAACGSSKGSGPAAACTQLGTDLKSMGADLTAAGRPGTVQGQPVVQALQTDEDHIRALVAAHPGAFATKVGPVADDLGQVIVDLRQAPGRITADTTKLSPDLDAAGAYCNSSGGG
jgi:hypothetical protein